VDWFFIEGWSIVERVIAPSTDGVCRASPTPATLCGDLCVGGRLGERGGRGGGSSHVAIRADAAEGGTRDRSPALAVTSGRSGLLNKHNEKEDSSSGLTELSSGKEWNDVGVDTSATSHVTNALMVLATRARPCGVPSTRSLGRKRSSAGSPSAEHGSRNLVTFDLRSMPSSCASTLGMDPGRNLFKSLKNS
jgi:hypothetical protein